MEKIKKNKFLLIVIVLLLMTGCQSNIQEIKENRTYKGDTSNGVTMAIKEGTLTNSSATIIITDNNKETNDYSVNYRLYKKEEDKWVSLKLIVDKYSMTLAHYRVKEDNKLEMEHNWEYLYGKLVPGEYKLVKPVYKINDYDTYDTVSVDFVIKDNS